MRRQRWQAIGAPDELKPDDSDIVSAEVDEDSLPDWDARSAGSPGEVAEVRAPGAAAADDATDRAERTGGNGGPTDDQTGSGQPDRKTSPDLGAPEVTGSRPFEDLPPLPDDLAEAVEVIKLAIVAHRMEGWSSVSRDDVLKTLDALKALVLAPPSE
jgi:hypothetical protein